MHLPYHRDDPFFFVYKWFPSMKLRCISPSAQIIRTVLTTLNFADNREIIFVKMQVRRSKVKPACHHSFNLLTWYLKHMFWHDIFPLHLCQVQLILLCLQRYQKNRIYHSNFLTRNERCQRNLIFEEEAG